MPWKVTKGLGCPPNKPYAVTKHDDRGRPVGDKLGCHATRGDANRQIAALYASERAAEKVADAALRLVKKRTKR